MAADVDFAAWVLEPADENDIDTLMQWFPDRAAVIEWGGPEFRFPFTRSSFLDDIHWGRIASFSLYSGTRNLVGFGQIYERESRIHLARIAVAPERRGLGAGRLLVERLMRAGRDMYRHSEYSLFVFRDNARARHCYESTGFSLADYPGRAPLADLCYYLVRPVDGRDNKATTGGEDDEQ